jgi:hypothetical protein
MDPAVAVAKLKREQRVLFFPLIIRPHRTRLELAARTPALRARGLDNLYQTQQAVASALDSESSTDRLRNSVAVGACLAAVSAASFQWAMGQGKDDPVALAREAFIVIGANLEGEQNEPRKIRHRRRWSRAPCNNWARLAKPSL